MVAATAAFTSWGMGTCESDEATDDVAVGDVGDLTSTAVGMSAKGTAAGLFLM